MYSLNLTLKTDGDRGVIGRVSDRLRNLRPAMQHIGRYGLGQAQQRLNDVLNPDPTVRTGLLGNSLQVFEVGNDYVAWGSNLPYAAQVQFGGVIEPINARALAIPLHPKLQRNQVGPLELDPTREILEFVPYTGGKPNVFGLLVNPEAPLTGRRRKKRGKLSTIALEHNDKPLRLALPVGPLYALAWWVSQEPRPYLYVDEEDVENIMDLVSGYLFG